MKGYKALDKNMRSVCGNGMQFELGKTYIAEGEVVLCENGFHFCERIEELNCYYDIDESRIFEVEAGGRIKSGDRKYAAQNIRLIRELTEQEINGYIKENLESFVKADSNRIRSIAVRRGYGLEELVHDADWHVRCEVAKQGYGLNILVHDKDWQVREEVARQGYGLDILVHDEDDEVRYAVAEQGYGLNILVYDKYNDVREEVARQGYGLDILAGDRCWYVRREAQKVLEASRRNNVHDML